MSRRDGPPATDPSPPLADLFLGYNPIRYTPCPDEFFDRQLADMDDDELRVTLYSFRRTFGFKKTDDAISISQYLHGIVTRDGRRLDSGCGLKTPRQVLAGLGKAERRRTIFSAFFCKSCGGRVPDETMHAEARTQMLVNGERRTYSVRVVPDRCGQCGRRLRGFEEKRYFLNVLDEYGRPSAASVLQGGSVPAIEGGVGASIPQIDPPVTPTPATTVPGYRPDSPATAAATETTNSVQTTGRQYTESQKTAARPGGREIKGSGAPSNGNVTSQREALVERWSAVTALLRDEMTARNFAAWVQPIQPLSWTGAELLLGVRDPSHADYLELRLRPSVERAAESVAGNSITVRVLLLPPV